METQPIDCLRIKFPLKTLRIYYLKTFKHFTHEVKIYGRNLTELTGFPCFALLAWHKRKLLQKVMSFLLLRDGCSSWLWLQLCSAVVVNFLLYVSWNLGSSYTIL